MIAEPPILEPEVAAEPRLTSAGRDPLTSLTPSPSYPVGRPLRVLACTLFSMLRAACTPHFFDKPAWSESLEMRPRQPCCDDSLPQTEWQTTRIAAATYAAMWLK
jgi:hypothetical protein